MAHVHGQERVDAVVTRGASCWSALAASSSEESASEAADAAVNSTRAAARDIVSSRLEDSDADGKAELGLVRRRLFNTSRSAAATRRELGRNARNGPLVRHGPD